ncbi:MAG: hypothetical protein MZW92_75590 [Comamonadaceae bacterium]|nr:hypothetical protein [Comamonadaceae bacterium]
MPARLVGEKRYEEARGRVPEAAHGLSRQPGRDLRRRARCPASSMTTPLAESSFRKLHRRVEFARREHGAPLPRPDRRESEAPRRRHRLVRRACRRASSTSRPRSGWRSVLGQQGKLEERARAICSRSRRVQQPRAGPAHPRRGAAAARRGPHAGCLRLLDERAWPASPTSPTCSTSRRWWRRSSAASTCWRRNLRKLIADQARPRACLQRAGLLACRAQRAAGRGPVADRPGPQAGARTIPSSSTAWAGCCTARATSRARSSTSSRAYALRAGSGDRRAPRAKCCGRLGRRDEARRRPGARRPRPTRATKCSSADHQALPALSPTCGARLVAVPSAASLSRAAPCLPLAAGPPRPLRDDISRLSR